MGVTLRPKDAVVGKAGSGDDDMFLVEILGGAVTMDGFEWSSICDSSWGRRRRDALSLGLRGRDKCRRTLVNVLRIRFCRRM